MPFQISVKQGSIDGQALPPLALAALEQSFNMIMITDSQLDLPGPKILYVNPAFTKFTGYTLEEVQGKTPRTLQGKQTDRTTLHELKQTLKKGEVFTAEAKNYKKDRTVYWVEWSISPIRNANGEVVCFLSISKDITEQKQQELKIQEQNLRYKRLFIKLINKIKDDITALDYYKTFEKTFLTETNVFSRDENTSTQTVPDLSTTPEYDKSQSLITFEDIDAADKEELDEAISLLYWDGIIYQAESINQQYLAFVSHQIRQIAQILTRYNDFYKLGSALQILHLNINDNMDEYLTQKEKLIALMNGLINDLQNWHKALFVTGAPSLDIFADSLISNIYTIIYICDKGQSHETEDQLDDIFF